jgi:hypothetical protein
MELLEGAKFINSKLRKKFSYIRVALLIVMAFIILMAGFAVAFLR